MRLLNEMKFNIEVTLHHLNGYKKLIFDHLIRNINSVSKIVNSINIRKSFLIVCRVDCIDVKLLKGYSSGNSK
jgi:hypothetical protein